MEKKTVCENCESVQAATSYVTALEEKSQELLEKSREAQQEMDAYYREIITQDRTEEAKQKAASFKRAKKNIVKAYRQTSAVQDELSTRILDLEKQRSRNLLINAPSNASIDLQEQELNHFASGINIYKLLLICFIGSFFGVVLEMLWCLFRNGYIESRAGMVYGPFNPLYGCGAVFLTVTLYRFRNKSGWYSFLGGMLVGSVLEYVCSWGQELVIGSRSWDYSNIPFNLNGRICLLYSVFWGILGVVWIKNLYPRIARWILKIPNKFGKIFTWVFLAFFIINGFMSMVSMIRWSQRTAGVAPSNVFWEVIDQRFPDERMERIYANMVFPDS